MVNVGVIDGSLCAAQLSLWQGAVPADRVLSCVGRLDRVGFDALDIMDGPLFRQCLQSAIDPWAWIRTASGCAGRTPLNAWISATTLFGAVALSQDEIVRGVACLAKAGVKRLTCYDVSNNTLSLTRVAQIGREAGMQCCAALVFSNFTAVSSLTAAARQLASGFDSVGLWDSAGAMSPELARELLPRMVEQCGGVAFELRAHCQSGRAEVIYLDALTAGVRTLHTCVDTLAGGVSLPSFEHLVRTARGRLANLDDQVAEGSSDYIAGFAEQSGLPVGRHQLADFDAERFEIPPDLISQLDTMTQSGIDRQALLEETRRLREQAGGVSMVYPLGGLLLQQAAVSIQDGESLDSHPANSATRMLAGVEELDSTSSAKRTSNASQADEAALTKAMFGSQQAEALRANGSAINMDLLQADTPLDLLISEIRRRPGVRAISVAKGNWRFELES